MINGIIEDNRSRVKFCKQLQKSHARNKQVDCCGILAGFLTRTTDPKQKPDRDLAAHTLAQVIAYIGATDKKKGQQRSNGIEEEQKTISPEDTFLDYLLNTAASNFQSLSRQTYTHCLMYLLRINDVAQEFVSKDGFSTLLALLGDASQHDAQIAYNVCTCFWILSHHKFALRKFQDFQLSAIEKIAKILDFSNKEKIVRMICRIFDVSNSAPADSANFVVWLCRT